VARVVAGGAAGAAAAPRGEQEARRNRLEVRLYVWQQLLVARAADSAWRKPGLDGPVLRHVWQVSWWSRALMLAKVSLG